MVYKAGVLDCFVAAESELQRTQVAPEADAFTSFEIAGRGDVSLIEKNFSDDDIVQSGHRIYRLLLQLQHEPGGDGGIRGTLWNHGHASGIRLEHLPRDNLDGVGTTWPSSAAAGTYMRIDGGTSAPGYLTAKAA